MLSEKNQFAIHINAADLAVKAGNYATARRELEEARKVYYAKGEAVGRGVPPRGFWSTAFDDMVYVRGNLNLAEKRRKNPIDVFEFKKVVTHEGYPKNGNAHKRRLYYGYLIVKNGKIVDGPISQLRAAKEAARDFHGYIEDRKKNPMRRNHHLKPGMRASGFVKVIKPFGLRKSGEDLYLVDGRALKPARKNSGKPKLVWKRDEDQDYLIARAGQKSAYVISKNSAEGFGVRRLPLGIYSVYFVQNWNDDSTERTIPIKDRVRGLDTAKKIAEDRYQKSPIAAYLRQA